MNQYGIRLVSLLLLPGLLVDPAIAGGFRAASAPGRMAATARFEGEALAEPALFGLTPLLFGAVLDRHAIVLAAMSFLTVGLAAAGNNSFSEEEIIFPPERAKALYDALVQQLHPAYKVYDDGAVTGHASFTIRRRLANGHDQLIRLEKEILTFTEKGAYHTISQIEFSPFESTLTIFSTEGSSDIEWSYPVPGSFVSLAIDRNRNIHIEVARHFLEAYHAKKKTTPLLAKIPVAAFFFGPIHGSSFNRIEVPDIDILDFEILGTVDFVARRMEYLPTIGDFSSTSGDKEIKLITQEEMYAYDDDPNHPVHFIPHVTGFFDYLLQNPGTWLGLLSPWTRKPLQISIVRGDIEDLIFDRFQSSYMLLVPLKRVMNAGGKFEKFANVLKRDASACIMNYFSGQEYRNGADHGIAPERPFLLMSLAGLLLASGHVSKWQDAFRWVFTAGIIYVLWQMPAWVNAWNQRRNWRRVRGYIPSEENGYTAAAPAPPELQVPARLMRDIVEYVNDNKLEKLIATFKRLDLWTEEEGATHGRPRFDVFPEDIQQKILMGFLGSPRHDAIEGSLFYFANSFTHIPLKYVNDWAWNQVGAFLKTPPSARFERIPPTLQDSAPNLAALLAPYQNPELSKTPGDVREFDTMLKRAQEAIRDVQLRWGRPNWIILTSQTQLAVNHGVHSKNLDLQHRAVEIALLFDEGLSPALLYYKRVRLFLKRLWKHPSQPGSGDGGESAQTRAAA